MLNVVQQHDAVALFLQPRHDVFNDAVARRQAMAVPAVDVSRKHAEVAAEQILDVDLGIAQIGEAEKRRDGVAQARFEHADALLDLDTGACRRELAQIGVAPGVGADGMAGLVDLFQNVGILQRHLADVEKRRLGALLGQGGENFGCGAGKRTVVEGQYNFLVAEKAQGMAVLQIADLNAAGGVNFLHASDTERIGVGAGVVGPRRGPAAQQHGNRENYGMAVAHQKAPPSPESEACHRRSSGGPQGENPQDEIITANRRKSASRRPRLD